MMKRKTGTNLIVIGSVLEIAYKGYSLRRREHTIPSRTVKEMRETYTSNSNRATGFRWAV